MGETSRCELHRRGERVFITVSGDFMDDVAIPAAERFDQLMIDAPGRVEIVAFVEGMRNYETPGRQAWMRTLAEHKSRLAAVTLIQCRSALVRMATAAMCLYAGVKIRFVDEPSAVASLLREAEEAQFEI